MECVKLYQSIAMNCGIYSLPWYISYIPQCGTFDLHDRCGVCVCICIYVTRFWKITLMSVLLIQRKT